MWILRSLTLLAVMSVHANTHAAPICTLVSDARSGTILHQQGECSQRYTPASTYKLALSLMGFDSGFLRDAHQPVFEPRIGDPDWGGANWLRPTDPERWIRYSVVWYSQRITHALGRERLESYARAFAFGNADMSGDPGKGNGLDRAWIMSSLKVSPLEQLRFQERLATRQLPVSERAMAITAQLALIDQRPAGWQVHGKTGAAFPRKADGAFDEARGYGWFVGWAEKDGRLLAFVRLEQDEQEHATSPGIRVRDTLLEEWPRLAGERR